MKDIGNVKDFSKEDLRFATSKEVADYRAKRLKCNRIVDLCSGIGIQSDAFAKTCKEVYGFEIDERKVDVSKKNFKNIKFEIGDVLDERVINQIRKIKPDVIFCDPERLASEKERSIESIKPDIKKLIEIYSKITSNLCIEIPPRIDLDKLKELEKFGGKFEAEYLSLENRLNRLDLLFGDLKKDERSVVDVKNGIRIVDNSKRKAKFNDKILNYIYEVNEAVIKANLINELAFLVGADILNNTEKNKVIFTSKSPSLEFGCFAKLYIVIGIVNKFEDINGLLKRNNFCKVVIKYSIDPKDYWKERNSIENHLRGDRESVVFKINNKYVVCEFYD